MPGSTNVMRTLGKKAGALITFAGRLSEVYHCDRLVVRMIFRAEYAYMSAPAQSVCGSRMHSRT